MSHSRAKCHSHTSYVSARCVGTLRTRTIIMLQHTSCVRPETAYVLGNLHQKGHVLGIGSNSQAYTLPELRAGLVPYGLSLELFEPTLCFFSYEYGFKKPDPYVFRIISVRLEAKGINPYEISHGRGSNKKRYTACSKRGVVDTVAVRRVRRNSSWRLASLNQMARLIKSPGKNYTPTDES